MRKGFIIVLLLTRIEQAQGQADPAEQHPAINWFSRWAEDWSLLADPKLRTDPFDPIKYIPLTSDPKSYLSLGFTMRERFESVSMRLTPIQPDDYLLDRMQLHADLHLGTHVQIFTQLIDVRAPGKNFLSPIDQDRLDLEQAFIAVTIPVGEGALNFTGGRQEPNFDMHRFGAVQEGPNMRQPFDAIQVGYTYRDWEANVFYARPVITRDRALFDDTSTNGFTFSGARLSRKLGPGRLTLFGAQLRNDDAFYLASAGHERRNVFDVHYVGRVGGWDWDGEGMDQFGDVGGKNIRAWGAGGLFGYTWTSARLSPRLGFQFDSASGTKDQKGDTVGTFNPLFPNGFYELLAGYPGYSNFVHLKSSVMVFPTPKLSVLFAGGSLWRQTTADAVYLLPAIPVAGTAGHGSAYSGSYGQVRLDWKISPHLTGALDFEQFAHSRSLRDAGMRNGHFIGVELKFGI